MNKLYMLFGIAVGILAAFLAGCQTSNQTVVVQHGPCGPNCAPSRARVIEREVVVVREQPVVRESPLWGSFIQVNVVPGNGACPPSRGRMIRRRVIQDCAPEWYERDWVPVNRGCPPPGYNGGYGYGGGGGYRNPNGY